MTEEKISIKRVKTHSLELTMHELVHLRDLMSIMLPPYGDRTVSAALADTNGRSCSDGALWNKLTELCKSAGIPTGPSAPDYVISVIEAPVMGVVSINLGSEMSEDEVDLCDDLPETVTQETNNG